jgi:hypothetical protein
MKVTTNDFTITFDAGSAMQRTPAGQSWTRVCVAEGEYPYDTDAVRATLQAYLDYNASDGDGVEADTDHYCEKCGQAWATHNDDGSCVVDDECASDDVAQVEQVPEAQAEPVEASEEAQDEIEGWRLTQRQYQERKAARVSGGVPVLNVADADRHREIVCEALERGEVVPTHVFKDYSDLWKPWEWPLETWLQMGHDIQRSGKDMRYIATPTGETVLWPSITSRKLVERLQHEYEVKRAAQQGRAIPANVLAGYPDLNLVLELPDLVLLEGSALALAVLYRDWLSVANGDESAYPSLLKLHHYCQAARQLVVGGERECEGQDFRRFCRVRLEGKVRGFDLTIVGKAYRAKRDFAPPDGWDCLRETDEHFATRSWESGWKPAYPCVRCGRERDEDQEWPRLCGCPVYLCPACHQEVLAWKDAQHEVQHHVSEAVSSAVRKAKRSKDPPTDETPGRRIPRGDLDVTFVDGVPDGILWTANLRLCQGEADLQAAFDYLAAVKAHVETEYGFQVFALRKWHDSCVTVTIIANAHPEHQYIKLEGWQDEHRGPHLYFASVKGTEVTVAHRLEHLTPHCSAEPDVPAGWNVPGMHLAKRVRALIRASAEMAGQDGRVAWADLWAMYDELVQADDLLRHLQEIPWPNDNRWLEGLGPEVIKPKPWQYVVPDERKLAKKYEGNPEALREALGKTPNKARLNYLLSALADLGAVPDGYISTEAAGGPSELPPCEPCSRLAEVGGQEAAEAQASAPTAAKPNLSDGIPEMIEVDLGRAKGWASAQVLRVKGRWLHYQIAETAEKNKVQLVGREIIWREATEGGS